MIAQVDPITLSGGISPSWVLTGVVTIMLILLWRMLVTMQKEIKENSESIHLLNTKVSNHEEKHENHEKEFTKIESQSSKLADEIIFKLRAARLDR